MPGQLPELSGETIHQEAMNDLVKGTPSQIDNSISEADTGQVDSEPYSGRKYRLTWKSMYEYKSWLKNYPDYLSRIGTLSMDENRRIRLKVLPEPQKSDGG